METCLNQGIGEQQRSAVGISQVESAENPVIIAGSRNDKKLLEMLNELSRPVRVGLALSLMAGAAMLTLGIMLIAGDYTSDSNSSETSATEVVQRPLILQTEQPSPVTLTATETTAPTLTSTPIEIMFVEPTLAEIGITFTPTIVPTLTPVSIAQALPDVSVVVVENGCLHPANWQAHTVQAGDTLFAFQLGSKNAVTVDQIITANCLEERLLYEGQVIWLP
ncbi:MAG TPA: LysM peptidoglycan-binding domain-containing protein, partial [Aggregatilineales bacterium]|nr:LysM peptidoglycan-binding domain-containing protein [Aggregatilineales bacterium]